MSTLEMQTSMLNEDVIWWKITSQLRGELTELPDVLEPVRRIADTEKIGHRGEYSSMTMGWTSDSSMWKSGGILLSYYAKVWEVKIL